MGNLHLQEQGSARVGTDARETAENGLGGQWGSHLASPTSCRFLAHPPLSPLRPGDTIPNFSPILAKTAGGASARCLLPGRHRELGVLGSRSPFPEPVRSGSRAELSTDCRAAAGDVSQSQDGRHAVRFSARSLRHSGEERQPPLRLPRWLPRATAREEDRREAGAVTMGMGEADGGAVASSLPQAGNGSSRAHHTAEPI